MVIGMGGGDPAPQTFLDRCEQGERRYRKRRGGGWDPGTFWDGTYPVSGRIWSIPWRIASDGGQQRDVGARSVAT